MPAASIWPASNGSEEHDTAVRGREHHSVAILSCDELALVVLERQVTGTLGANSMTSRGVRWVFDAVAILGFLSSVNSLRNFGLRDRSRPPPRPSASASRARSPASRRTLAPRSADALAMHSSSVCATCLPRCLSGSPGRRLPVGSRRRRAGRGAARSLPLPPRTSRSSAAGLACRPECSPGAPGRRWRRIHRTGTARSRGRATRRTRGRVSAPTRRIPDRRRTLPECGERGFAGGAGCGGEVCRHESISNA